MSQPIIPRDIRKLKLEELKEFFIAQGDKAFRAQQVYDWLWIKSAKTFEQALRGEFIEPQMHADERG